MNNKSYYILISILFFIGCKQSSDSYFDQARKKHDQNDLKGAIEDYSSAIELDSTIATYFYNRGVAHLELNETVPAIQNFSKSIELDSLSYSAFYNRGIAEFILNKYDNAIQDFSKTVELYNIAEIENDSTKLKAYFNRAVAKEKINDFVGAISDYSKVILLSDTVADAYYNRGILNYYKMNNREAGCSDLKNAEIMGSQIAKSAFKDLCNK